MAFQGQACNRLRFGYSSAFRWSLRGSLSRIGKQWSHMESTLTVISPPSPCIEVAMRSPMLLVLYVSTVAAGAAFRMQEHRPGHQKRWNISCKDRRLRRPVEVFARSYWANGKEEGAFAGLSRANSGRHREPNYHTPSATLEQSPTLKVRFPKVTGDESGRSPMSSSDMTLVIRVV